MIKKGPKLIGGQKDAKKVPQPFKKKAQRELEAAEILKWSWRQEMLHGIDTMTNRTRMNNSNKHVGNSCHAHRAMGFKEQSHIAPATAQ